MKWYLPCVRAMAPPTSSSLQRSLLKTLRALDIDCHASADKAAVELLNGLRLEPILMASESIARGRFRSSTVIEIRHAQRFENVLFEYQHSTGKTSQSSITAGFRSWAQMDLPTLLDACQDELEDCSALEMSYPARDNGVEFKRQVLLGPMAHYQEHPAATLEEHEFCPCCLFTKSMNAFSELLTCRGFFGIRLYASRDGTGHCEADCRVNGNDFQAALPLLRAYAASWPDAGMEYRKQYVVIRNLYKSSTR